MELLECALIIVRLMLTVPDGFPLPRIDDLIDRVSGAAYVTRLDLLRGYYQVPLTQRAQEISAFTIQGGLFNYRVMPFGLCNAASTFQRLMNLLTNDLEGVDAYLDLVIYSNEWEQHLIHLETLFKKLEKYNFTINLAKCQFGQAKIKYLGFCIGQGEVRPVDVKVRAIAEFPIPQDRKSIQRFLGMTGYYRRFCPNFSQVASPLTELTSSKMKFCWTKDCEIAFNRLKRLLSSSPVLKSPDFNQPFYLHIDASGYAVGAVLLQKSPSTDILHPISYFSSKLKRHQKNYATVEKEALALVISLEHFDIYLGTSPIKLWYFLITTL